MALNVMGEALSKVVLDAQRVFIMRLALTYNVKKDTAPSKDAPEDCFAEWDEYTTIKSVREALLKRHEEVVLVEADEDCYEKLRKSRPELVFNMAEGLRGESRESHVPA
ncbi:MAG: D-alanine--D-alanine ligase, partial [Deltaproteobacteria bacterium]|nr:D-alanine--D-alanine ligase [Deltaproteobacteria bacterium]